MFLKATGLVCILLSGIALGNYFAKKNQRRIKELSLFYALFHQIERQISFLNLSTGDILEQLACEDQFLNFDFIKILKKKFQENQTLSTAWYEALNTYQEKTALLKEDISFLQDFAGIFGATDAKGQIESCEYFKNRLEEQRKDAVKNNKTKEKISYTLGVFGGLFFCILFL